MFIPIRTDTPLHRTPHVNRLLIVLNVLVYIVVDVFGAGPRGFLSEGFKLQWMLDPHRPQLVQFFSYQFLHGDFLHLAGNMLFLWVFGNSVNAKMGQVPYLFFYLAAGVFAGVGFAITGDAPCLGASGAIAGITTAFMVLFPRSGVTVFYWFWLYVGTFQIQAMLLILLKIILWDNILAPNIASGSGVTAVAYSAHIAGYLFGFLWCSLMLLVRALPRDQYDIVALVKRYRQRQQFRALMANPNTAARAAYGRVARPISAAGPAEADVPLPLTPEQEEISRLRSEIGELLDRRDYVEAAARYETLVQKQPEACLPRRQMLEVANQLMTAGRYRPAASAYETFLKHFPTDAEAQQVKLVLGIIYAKYLELNDKAQKHLRECVARLNNPEQIKQARHWLDTVTAALGPGADPV